MFKIVLFLLVLSIGVSAFRQAWRDPRMTKRRIVKTLVGVMLLLMGALLGGWLLLSWPSPVPDREGQVLLRVGVYLAGIIGGLVLLVCWLREEPDRDG